MKPDAIRRVCDAYLEAVARGKNITTTIAWLSEAEGVGRPAIWRRLRSGGALPPYSTRTNKTARRTRSEIVIEKLFAPRVDRDPCPRCGVRGDIDCGHSKAPLGMVL